MISQSVSTGKRRAAVSSIADVARPAPSSISIGILVTLARAGDMLAVFAGALIASYGVRLTHDLDLDYKPELLISISATFGTWLAFRALNAYSFQNGHKLRRRIVTRCVGIVAALPIPFVVIALLPTEAALLPYWPLQWAAGSIVLICTWHAVAALALQRWTKAGRFSRRVAVVGLNDLSISFLERAGRHRDEGFEVVGIYDDGGDIAEVGYPVLGGLSDVVARGRRERIDAVVLAIPLTQPERIEQAKQALSSMVADIYLTTGLAGLRFQSAEVQDFASTPMVRVRPRPLSPWQTLQKAMFDRLCAAMLLLVLSPPLLVIALLIKRDSAGPVLFRQPRLGFNNVIFTVYKFRTMRHEAADLLADKQTLVNDSRITRIGRVLRKFSLDELPQLFNVLEGTMSLVGPRPHAPNTKAGEVLFHDAVEEYALRHRVKPGITGWAQANGWRGETRTLEQIQQRVAHDLYYIDNWSLRFDIRILMLTLVREINSKTAF